MDQTTPSRSERNGGRFYTVADGVQLPSVTTILNVVGKPALIQWAAREERNMVSDVAADLYADLAKVPPMSRTAYLTTLTDRLGKQRANQKLLAKAAEIGSQVHAMAEWNFRRALGQKVGPEPKIEDRAQWAFMALEDWATSVRFKPLKIEQTVWSTTHGYAGTMDLLALVNDVPTLVDFKTGKAIYAEAHLQNVAYQVAYNEMGHDPQAQAGLIVRLPKVETDPAFETAVVPSVAELFPVFQAAHRLWVWWYAGEQAYHARQKPAPAVKDKAADSQRSLATGVGSAEQPTPVGAGPSMTPEDAAWVKVKEQREAKKISKDRVMALIASTYPHTVSKGGVVDLAKLHVLEIQNLALLLGQEP